MNKLKNLLLKLLPLMILGYNGMGFYEKYNEHQTQVENLNSQKESILGKINVNKIKLSKIEKFKENLDASKKRIEELNEQIKKVQQQLPTDINDTEVIANIQKEAELINVKETVLTPLSETVQGFYISKGYDLSSYGTFLQFAIFFERLKNSDRLFNVKKMKIASDGVKQKGRFTLVKCETTLESFKYNSQYDQKSGVEDIESQFKVNN